MTGAAHEAAECRASAAREARARTPHGRAEWTLLRWLGSVVAADGRPLLRPDLDAARAAWLDAQAELEAHGRALGLYGATPAGPFADRF